MSGFPTRPSRVPEVASHRITCVQVFLYVAATKRVVGCVITQAICEAFWAAPLHDKVIRQQ